MDCALIFQPEQSSQEGIECSRAKEQVRTYCPNICLQLQSSNKDFLNRYSKAKKPLAHCVKVGNWQNSWRFQLENDMGMKPGQLHAVWLYKDHHQKDQLINLSKIRTTTNQDLQLWFQNLRYKGRKLVIKIDPVML